jgi:hypothetical protein
MRHVVLGLLVLLQGTSAQAQSSWADKLFKSDLTHDFGNVPRGTQLYHRFKLNNIYKVPLEIETQVGCHCVTITAATSVIEPLQDGYIDIKMDTSKFPGPKRVKLYVTVRNGAQYQSMSTLEVSANSRTDVVLNPGQINFGVVSGGQTPTPQVIDVEYAGVLNWTVNEIVRSDAPIEATFKELYRRPGQVGYRVTVSLKPNAPAGALKQELFLKTNDPAVPLVPILVEGNIQGGGLSVYPSTIALGSLKVEETVTKRVMVRAGKDFRIVGVDGLGEGVTTEPLPAAAAQVQYLLIKCHPTKAGPLQKQLRIKTDLDPDTPATVKVEGTVEP